MEKYGLLKQQMLTDLFQLLLVEMALLLLLYRNGPEVCEDPRQLQHRAAGSPLFCSVLRVVFGGGKEKLQQTT